MKHPPFNAPTPEEMNALLPAFDFKTVIASDEFAVVYLANQRTLERDVAIKLLAPHMSEDSGFSQVFETTARSMAKLNHPNLIGVFDSGCVDQMLYFVMEFVPGKSLGHSIRGKAVDFEQAAALIEGISAGLAHAHDHQIVHGELNPAKILLNQKAEPKIGSFGSPRPTEESRTSPLSHFIAPELLEGSGTATPRSDIFSVGAILYELLTGLPQGPDAVPPSSLVACDPKVDEVWRKATAVDPAGRFADVKSFQTAFQAAAKGKPRTTALLQARKPMAAKAVPERGPSSASGGGPDAPVSPPLADVAGGDAKVGFNWSLLRNVIIILGLVYAINLAWKNLETKRIERERQRNEVLAKEDAKKELAKAEELKRAEERKKLLAAAGGNTTTKDPVPEVPVKKEETPEESLARLREDLATGDRDEMPVGSVRKGDCDYFLVTESMTWPEAAWFAERHGGHLAFPSAAADLTWMVANLGNGEGFWIGAAKAGRNIWSLADGTEWRPKKEPTGLGQYLAVDKHGFLHAESVKTSSPFVIQWHRDGTNPGTLEKLLAVTRESLGNPNPSYPPGTRSYGVRNYLYVARPVKWREAVDLAQSAGGTLMVAGGIAEMVNIEEMTSDLVAKDGIWLGGFLKGDQWVWITGEPWKSAKWAENAVTTEEDSVLVIRPGRGWDARNLGDVGSGFIIEWSKDGSSTTAPEMRTETPTDESVALVAMARKLILAADDERTKKLADNSRKLTWDLDVFIRGLSKGGQTQWSPHVERIKLSVKENRVPASIDPSSGIQLSEKMAELAKYHAKHQDKIDAEFRAEAEKLRLAFTGKLQELQSKAKASGQPKLAESIGGTLSGAEDLSSWVRSFGVELQPRNPVATGPDSVSPRPFPRPEPGGGISIE